MGSMKSGGDDEPGETAARDDPGAGDQDAAENAPSTGFDSWRKESTIGGLGTGIARGLQAVFAPPPHEVAIVASVPGDPPDADQSVRVILDPEDPTKSVAFIPEAVVHPSPGRSGAGSA